MDKIRGFANLSATQISPSKAAWVVNQIKLRAGLCSSIWRPRRKRHVSYEGMMARRPSPGLLSCQDAGAPRA